MDTPAGMPLNEPKELVKYLYVCKSLRGNIPSHLRRVGRYAEYKSRTVFILNIYSKLL